jgi:triple functional domain protein
LDHLVQVCNQPGSDKKHGDGTGNFENRPGGNPAADYSEGASHVLAVIHQILNHHRALEQKWHAKKIKLHQRLALRLFQEDVKQVSDTYFSLTLTWMMFKICININFHDSCP